MSHCKTVNIDKYSSEGKPARNNFCNYFSLIYAIEQLLIEGVRSKRAFFAIQPKLGSKGPFNFNVTNANVNLDLPISARKL